jgi:hypothetical protein
MTPKHCDECGQQLPDDFVVLTQEEIGRWAYIVDGDSLCFLCPFCYHKLHQKNIPNERR